MKRLLFVCFLLLPMLAWTQRLKPSQPLPPEESKARLERLGDSLRKYNWFGHFDRHGWMVVEKNNRWGIIDDEGRALLPCEYGCICFQEHSDLILVEKDSFAGFIDRQLHWVIPPKYQGSYLCERQTYDFFHYGMLEVADSDFRDGVVDTLGNEILPCRYGVVEIAGPDLFLIDNRGAINRSGDTIIPFIYKEIGTAWPNVDYLIARKDNLWGVLDKKGREILPFQYEDFYIGRNGFFPMKYGGKWGIVDSLGQVVLPFIYDGRPSINSTGFVDLEVKAYYESYKLLDMSGREVTPFVYLRSLSSTSGDKIALIGIDNKSDYENGEYGEIYSRSGEFIESYEDFAYDMIDEIEEPTMIPVRKHNKWGFVNLDFELVVPCAYESNEVYGGYGYATVTTSEGETILFDEQGNQLIAGQFRWLIPSINGWFKVEYAPQKSHKTVSGFIDRYGNSTFTDEDWKLIQGTASIDENLRPVEEGTNRTINDGPTDTNTDISRLEMVETMPEYPGGIDSLLTFIRKNLKYPAEDKENGVLGIVLAEFVVEKDGSVSNIKIVVSLSPACDAEVVRVLSLMPKWVPGTAKGNPVRVYYRIPIRFEKDQSVPEKKKRGREKKR